MCVCGESLLLASLSRQNRQVGMKCLAFYCSDCNWPCHSRAHFPSEPFKFPRGFSSVTECQVLDRCHCAPNESDRYHFEGQPTCFAWPRSRFFVGSHPIAHLTKTNNVARPPRFFFLLRLTSVGATCCCCVCMLETVSVSKRCRYGISLGTCAVPYENVTTTFRKEFQGLARGTRDRCLSRNAASTTSSAGFEPFIYVSQPLHLRCA